MPGDVARPGYDPAAHGAGVVHIGPGAFHRAHQAAYFDRLMACVGGDWRIIALSLHSTTARDQLVPQDGLFTLEVVGDGASACRIVAAIANIYCVAEDPVSSIAALASPCVSLVTLTITEKGYCHEAVTGMLDMMHPGILADLGNTTSPRTAIGLLAAGLDQRRAQGARGLTLMSCDNLAGNGDLLARVLIAYCACLDPALAAWVEAHCTFPNSMVDRIVPSVTAATRDEIAHRIGCRDEAAVRTEAFSQWVLEDRFAGPRPDLATCGVTLVGDVRPFEASKLRLLNGAHSLLAYAGLLHGFTYVHDAIADPALRRAVDLLHHDSAQTLRMPDDFDIAAYAASLRNRFASRALPHALSQIAVDGSKKLPQRLLAPIRLLRRAQQPFGGPLAGVAAWIVYIITRVDAGLPIDDPMADRLRAAVATGGDATCALLAVAEIFGDDLPNDRGFVAALKDQVKDFSQNR